MPVEIVKVQRPIFTNDPNEPWLIYDRWHQHIESKLPHRIREDTRKAMGSDFKGYFKGAWSSVVGWGLSERVEDQNW